MRNTIHEQDILKQITTFRRSGATLLEFWSFLTSKTESQYCYQKFFPDGKIALEMWSYLLHQERLSFFLEWAQKYPHENHFPTPWWQIIHRYSALEYSQALYFLNTCLSKANRKSEVEAVIPGLLLAIDHEDSYVRYAALQALSHTIKGNSLVLQKILPLAQDPDSLVRNYLFSTLGVIGDSRPEILSCLTNALQDEATLNNAIFALGNFGAKAEIALSQLVSLLDGPYPYIFQDLVWVFGQIGEASFAVIPTLIERYHSPLINQSTRYEILFALSKIAGTHPEVIHFLKKALEDSDPEICRTAIIGLRRAGPQAVHTLPKLQRCLNHSHEELRREASITIGRMGEVAQSLIPNFLERLEKDPNRIVRRNVAKALGYFGYAAKEAIPLLKKILMTETDEYLCMNAGETLEKMGWTPMEIHSLQKKRLQIPETPDVLLKWLQIGDFIQKEYAVWALGQQISPSHEIVSTLIHVLQDARFQMRCNAAWSLGNFGLLAIDAIPSLLQILQNQHPMQNEHEISFLSTPDLHRNAARALGNIGHYTPEIEEVLSSCIHLSYSDKHLYFWAGISLGKLKKRLMSAFPAIIKALKDDDYFYVRAQAALTLGDLGEEALPFVSDLQQIQREDPSLFVRQEAHLALKKIAGNEFS